MAWINPVYDRANEKTRTTATDMNRIANNMAELGGSPVKTDYTEADIVKAAEWTAIIEFAKKRKQGVTEAARFDNLNRIEYMMKRLHDGHKWNEYAADKWNEQPTWSDMQGGE